jgi:GcrA cell cycle regulator
VSNVMGDHKMEWSEDVIGQLRALWGEGHSTAEIGRRLGVTKNAIVGKAHRLDLPARPSPIRRDPNAAPVRRTAVRRVEGPTLPPLPSTVADTDASFSTFSASSAIQTQARAPSIARRIAPAPRPVVQTPRPVSAPSPRPVAVAPRPYGRIVTCCWPLGEPGTRDFRFCDVPSEPGRPYCEDHVKVAYVRVRDRRDDAA